MVPLTPFLLILIASTCEAIECSIEVHLNISTHARLKLKP